MSDKSVSVVVISSLICATWAVPGEVVVLGPEGEPEGVFWVCVDCTTNEVNAEAAKLFDESFAYHLYWIVCDCEKLLECKLNE